jgi:hypothetical protein
LIRFLDGVEHPGADGGWTRFGFVLSHNECEPQVSDFINVNADHYPGIGFALP